MIHSKGTHKLRAATLHTTACGAAATKPGHPSTCCIVYNMCMSMHFQHKLALGISSKLPAQLSNSFCTLHGKVHCAAHAPTASDSTQDASNNDTLLTS